MWRDVDDWSDFQNFINSPTHTFPRASEQAESFYESVLVTF